MNAAPGLFDETDTDLRDEPTPSVENARPFRRRPDGEPSAGRSPSGQTPAWFPQLRQEKPEPVDPDREDAAQAVRDYRWRTLRQLKHGFRPPTLEEDWTFLRPIYRFLRGD